MPGSPPKSSTEPRTKPPPVTRSSSDMPDGRRGASLDSPVSASSANLRPLRGARPGILPAMPVPSPSSTSVFHSPQASHLPTQRGEAAPQFWQTNVRLRRDMLLSDYWSTREARRVRGTVYRWSERPHPNPLSTGEGAHHRCCKSVGHKLTHAASTSWMLPRALNSAV